MHILEFIKNPFEYPISLTIAIGIIFILIYYIIDKKSLEHDECTLELFKKITYGVILIIFAIAFNGACERETGYYSKASEVIVKYPITKQYENCMEDILVEISSEEDLHTITYGETYVIDGKHVTEVINSLYPLKKEYLSDEEIEKKYGENTAFLNTCYMLEMTCDTLTVTSDKNRNSPLKNYEIPFNEEWVSEYNKRQNILRLGTNYLIPETQCPDSSEH